MNIETNHILYVARLPVHFWCEFNNVADYRDNPGLWLQSYVVAKTLNLEYTDLPAELQQAFAECEAFTENLSGLVDWFGKQLKVLLTATPETHHLYGALSTLAYNFFAGMGINTVLGNRRDLLITSKLEYDQLKSELLKPTPPPKQHA